MPGIVEIHVPPVSSPAAASRVACLDGVPAGAFAMLTEEGAEEIGMGRRVNVPLR